MGRFIKQIWQLPRVALKQFASDVLRLALLLNRPRRLAQKGFVLPTTVLLTIMVALTATALTYRTFIRSEQAIGQREQQVIVNAATPAIDRAKAKIEFLFRKDGRLPAGLPSSDILYDLMSTKLGTGNFVGYTGRYSQIDAANPDPYTLPDETRVDINGDGDLDNAWSFSSEGKTLVYSILVDDEVRLAERTPPAGSITRPRLYVNADRSLKDAASKDKANSLITRTGPLATAQATPNCQGSLSEGGWQVVTQGDNSQLQKNFQINAFVANNSDVNQTFETLEFQQSRQAARGNKWGAWFRYDLELFPGPAFNWNGAIHTDSNLVLHRPADPIHLHMVSAPSSCVYSQEASEITLGERNLDGVAGINPQTTPAGQTPDFQGQVLGAFTKDNQYKSGNGPNIHLFDGRGNPPITANGVTNLNRDRDSVNPEGTLSDVAANPLTLFVEDETQHINPSSWRRDPAWNTATNPFGEQGRGRILNDAVNRPYVDDFYRADDRWGPKPKYDDNNAIPPGQTVGDRIIGNNDLTNPAEGLDGYWERQAMQKGLRLIVGQRLELGNANGWNSNPAGAANTSTVGGITSDPLYPANKRKGTGATATELTGNTVIGGDHEYLQRKALRDNLAAVQGMVVYHYERNNGEFPAACVALTAHPGTRQTIVGSRTFGTWLGSTTVKTDFLNGKGTNGWEFQFPSGASGTSDFNDPTSFATAIRAGEPLGNALRNLAYFAGDRKGGAPSFKPVQDTVAHPFPYMAMWGDFSPLRRIFEEYVDRPTSPVSYANLSPADQATLHSAACTLGMLAYNLKSAEDEFANLNAAGSTSLQNLALRLNAAAGADGSLIEDGKPLKDWLDVLDGVATPTPDLNEDEVIEALARWGQINRDRQYGFALPPAPATPTCTPAQFTGVVNPVDQNNLAAAFCSGAEPPKYPSLFYLFPKSLHDQTGIGPGSVVQPPAEEYIDQSSGTKYIATVNSTINYEAVTPASISLSPQPLTGSNWVLPVTTTTTQITTTNLEGTPDNAFKINAGTGALRVPFLDKGIYDGREQLNTRVLDIDLEALTTQTVGTDYWLSANLDRQAEGIVYAFREDAVREDEIVRPKGTVDAAYCSETTDTPNGRRFRIEQPTEASCRMQVLPGSGGTVQDPPLTDDKFISLKPVDFIPDPERRTHGFRLRTASGNPADFSGNNYARQVGMTLVTDNPAYIMGDFNLHSTDGRLTGLVEEFTATLQNVALGDGFVAPFYNRTTQQLNTANFANLARDHWRPVEILADAISILSINFRDGAVEDGFLRPEEGARGGATSSYMNQNRPRQFLGSLLREDGSTGTVPAYIDRNGTYYPNGQPFYTQYITNGLAPNGWLWFRNPATDASIDDTRRVNTQTATPTSVNAVFISGIVPKRRAQTYGGLHNFPRFLEHWAGVNLNISGAFFQLNFATTATGPFEQDAWESGQNPVLDTEAIGYFTPPNRRWGYDVGLLYVPPAPVARRFVTFGAPRSEYYRELPADDPYVVNLRCARNANGALVFPDNNVCPS